MTLKTLEDYRSNLRTGVRGLWSGGFSYYDFIDHMSLAIERGYTQAWYEGAKIYGVLPDELTEFEHDAITAEVNKEISFLYSFGQAIMSNLKAFGGKLEPLLNRAELWASGYNRMRTMGEVYAAGDQKMEWVYGDTIHCNSCLNYNGRVYRASTWLKYNIQPQMWELECHGIHCQCKFVPTDKRANRGFPPAP